MRPLEGASAVVRGALNVVSLLELMGPHDEKHKGEHGHGGGAEHGKGGEGHDSHEHGGGEHGKHSEHGSGGHGGGHGGHGGGDDNLRVALSLTTVGAVLALMVVMYLVNSRASMVRRATWSIISATVCIFSAVLIFTSINEVTDSLFIGESANEHAEGHGHEAPTVFALALDLSKACLLYAILEATLIKLRQHEKTLEAAAKIGAHVVGFALIEFFGTMQLMSPFSSSPLYSILIVVLAALLVVSISMACSYFRSHHFSEEERRHEEFIEVTAEAEDDYIGLLMGMLLCQVTKFVIVGEIAPLHGNPMGKTPMQVALLMLAALILSGLLVLVSSWQQKLVDGEASKRMRRAAHVIEAIVAMSLGWHSLYAGQWLFWTLTSGEGVASGDVLVAGLLRFAVNAMVGVAAIFILDRQCDYGWLPRRTVTALVGAVGLLLGLSWEQCVDTSVKGMHTIMPHNIKFVDAFVDMTLALFVVPAWALYIRPHANEGGEEEEEADGEWPSPSAKDGRSSLVDSPVGAVKRDGLSETSI
mmetsp:Transcript_42889/g.98395  ORF Transcript_42889/g.98395 Transcript_42889/m.98395 type:complete len:530 (-) Transcript_42889:92-1681(-)